jgi:DNA-binding CsgD family transcriptional regulator/tetratricopeptide (TPR) repeat protein
LDTELYERADQLARLDAELAAAVASGGGRVIAIGGEAGAGKTSLVRAFCAGAAGSPIVLRGGCDALYAARPLGPFVEIAESLGDGLAETTRGGRADEVASSLLAEIDARGPAIVVLEDLHWADETTLDVVRLLARRVESRRALVLLTYRDDEIDRAHPFRLLLGDLPASLGRLKVLPLSEEAVVGLADGAGLDGEELYRKTAGNPFFVTEVVAAPGEEIPDTVRDAVLARAARLEPEPQAVLEAIAVTSPHTELWLLESLVPDAVAHLDRCLSSGIVTLDGETIAFRHELARLAIDESLPPARRRELHRAALEALTASALTSSDAARLAFHAEGAGDVEALLVQAPAAAAEAARLGAHRDAALQYERALAQAGSMAPEQRADLLGRYAQECYLLNRGTDAIESGRAAVEAFRMLRDRLGEVNALLRLATIERVTGHNDDAVASVAKALELLEQVTEARPLAMAYAATAQIAMCNGDAPRMFEAAKRGIELAEWLGDVETLVHVLITVGTMEMEAPSTQAEGREKLLRSIELAKAEGLGELVARAYNNLAYESVAAQDVETGESCIREAIEYCTARGLDVWLQLALGSRAELELIRGDWDAAAETATQVLASPGAVIPRMGPLVVLGLVRARRGDPDPWGPLDEAAAIARASGELQSLVIVATARAETAWLEGRNDLVGDETGALVERARLGGDDWALRDLVLWRHRAGLEEPPAPGDPSPRPLELTGHPELAAERWTALGYPYEAALALAACGDEASQRRAVDELQQLGARAAAAIVARRLRERGLRGIPRGPRSSTARNPHSLTRRELEVLVLVAEGLSDAEIAGRLFLSEKTVGHHVSAILRKLGVARRGQAAAEAARLGLVETER